MGTAKELSWRKRPLPSSVRPSVRLSVCRTRFSRISSNELTSNIAERYLSTISPDHFFSCSSKLYIMNILQFLSFSLALDAMNGKLSNDISESTQQIHSQNVTDRLLGLVVKRVVKFYNLDCS